MRSARHQIILSVCMLLMALLLSVGAAIAWFGTRFSTSNIVMNSGEVKAEFKLYKYDDFNQDGLPDHDFTTDTPIYREVTGSEIRIDNFMPGDVHTYRIEVNNQSTSRAIYNLVDVHFSTADPIILGKVIEVGRRYTDAEGQLHSVNRVISIANKASDGNYVRLGGSDDVIASSGISILDLYITFLTDVPDTDYNTLQNVTFSIPQIDISLMQA